MRVVSIQRLLSPPKRSKKSKCSCLQLTELSARTRDTKTRGTRRRPLCRHLAQVDRALEEFWRSLRPAGPDLSKGWIAVSFFMRRVS